MASGKDPDFCSAGRTVARSTPVGNDHRCAGKPLRAGGKVPPPQGLTSARGVFREARETHPCSVSVAVKESQRARSAPSALRSDCDGGDEGSRLIFGIRSCWFGIPLWTREQDRLGSFAVSDPRCRLAYRFRRRCACKAPARRTRTPSSWPFAVQRWRWELKLSGFTARGRSDPNPGDLGEGASATGHRW